MRSPSRLQDCKIEKQYQWSNREMSWYKSENRYLFAADTELEMLKWISALKWILQSE
jgi:hypothetical protein